MSAPKRNMCIFHVCCFGVNPKVNLALFFAAMSTSTIMSTYRQRALVCFSDAGCVIACRRLCHCLLSVPPFPFLLPFDSNVPVRSCAKLANDCHNWAFSSLPSVLPESNA